MHGIADAVIADRYKGAVRNLLTPAANPRTAVLLLAVEVGQDGDMRVLLIAALAACGTSAPVMHMHRDAAAMDAEPDAARFPDAGPLPDAYVGDACQPHVTWCMGYSGIVVNGQCEQLCGADYPRCTAGQTERHMDDGCGGDICTCQ